MFGHQLEAVAQGGQHPQAQQVELDQAHRRAVVLVPLQDAAVLHAPPLHGADLGHRPVTHDHPPGVDAQVAGEVLDLRSQGQHLGGDVVVDVAVGAPLVLAVDHVAPAVDLLGPGILLAGGVAQGLGHVPHRRAGPVGDDVGHLGGIGPAVALVDVLDGLLPPVALDVDVDVRRAVPLRGEEALEEQAQPHRVGVGDPEGVADRRVGGAAPPLAEDPVLPAERHDVPDHQEVPREPQLLDHPQLVIDLPIRRPPPRRCRCHRRSGARFAGHGREIRRQNGGVRRSGAVAGLGALFGEVAEEGHLVVAGRAGERRQVRGHQVQVEGALAAQGGGPFDRPRVAGEAPGLLVARTQVGPGGGREPAVDLVQGAAGPDRGQGGGQPAAGGVGVVDVVGGHDVDAEADGDLGQTVVAGAVQRVAVVPQLDGHVLPPEGVDQAGQLPLGGGGPLLDQRPGHRPLATARQHQPVVPGPVVTGQLPQGGPGSALLPRHLRPADGCPQPGVAHRVPGQDHQVVALGVGLAHLGAGHPQGQLGPEDGGQPVGPGRLGEADHAVEAVVIGQGQGLQPQADGLLGQLLGVGGPVQEAEVRVAVQLRVGRGPPPPLQGLGLVLVPLTAPGRAVAPVGARPVRLVQGRGPLVREPSFELRPRDRRVPPPHAPTVSNTCSLRHSTLGRP